MVDDGCAAGLLMAGILDCGRGRLADSCGISDARGWENDDPPCRCGIRTLRAVAGDGAGSRLRGGRGMMWPGGSEFGRRKLDGFSAIQEIGEGEEVEEVEELAGAEELAELSD